MPDALDSPNRLLELRTMLCYNSLIVGVEAIVGEA